MRLTVIVPVLNDGDYLSALLRSIRTSFPGEVLAIDGGSSDGSIELSLSYNARVWAGPSGLAARCNLGARHASGDVLLFALAGGELVPSWEGAIEEALDSTYVIGGGFRLKSARPDLFSNVQCWSGTLRAHSRNSVTRKQGLFVRKDIFESVGGMKIELTDPFPSFIDEIKKKGSFVISSHSILSFGRK